MTDRLSLEAQVRHSVKMEAVGQLAAGVAHDFNNILTIIQGHSDLLLRNPKTGQEHRKPIQQISSAAERAGKIIRQLLMFSRKHIVQLSAVDINEVFANSRQMLHALLGEQITLVIQREPSLPSVMADTSMIEQVLINMAMNARDAMSDKGTLTIGAHLETLESITSPSNPYARSGRYVALSIKDTGCGMDERTLDHLFEPFFTTKEVGKGTGLGLATVYGIIKQHQGWIVVDSKVGAGTTFNIFLPAAVTQADLVPRIDLSITGVAGGTEGILVVEDESDLRDLVVNVLELYGYRTYQANTGVSAIKLWEEHKDQIDLLLTDVIMPEGMTGPQLARRLLDGNPKLKIIYTSGYSPGMLAKDIKLSDGSNFLPKPYKPMRLVQMLRETLDHAPK